MKRLLNNHALLLWIGGTLSVILLVPYLYEISFNIPEGVEVPVSLNVLALITVVQTSLFMALASWGGVALAKRCTLPYEVTLKKSWKSIVKYASLGVVLGLVLLIVDYAFYLSGVSLTFFTAELPVWWKGLLASFYGGWGEELLLRFFLVALFSRILMFLAGQKFVASSWMKLIAVFAAALFFALGHLPAVSALTDLTIVIVLRVLILNGAGGIVFGLIYLNKGFLPAVITHFFADIILQVMFPLMINL